MSGWGGESCDGGRSSWIFNYLISAGDQGPNSGHFGSALIIFGFTFFLVRNHEQKSWLDTSFLPFNVTGLARGHWKLGSLDFQTGHRWLCCLFSVQRSTEFWIFNSSRNLCLDSAVRCYALLGSLGSFWELARLCSASSLVYSDRLMVVWDLY